MWLCGGLPHALLAWRQSIEPFQQFPVGNNLDLVLNFDTNEDRRFRRSVGHWFIVGASLLTTLIVLAMTVTENVGPAWFLVFVAGLASTSFFPTILGITFAKFSPRSMGVSSGSFLSEAYSAVGPFPRSLETQRGDRRFRRSASPNIRSE